MKINVTVWEMGGTHIDADRVRKIRAEIHEVPEGECKEVRADWGEYRPVVTFPAIERALKVRGLIPYVNPGFKVFFGIEK